MVPSPLRSKAHHHGRSLSLPSGSHPSISQFDENLSRVRASEEATCSSLSSMTGNLNSLKELYSNIDDLLLLPRIQQTISQKCQESWVDQVLDGYIRILDACRTAQDLLSQAKHDVKELLSDLRRKNVHGIHDYLASRKRSKKTIQKSLKNLRSFRTKYNVQCLEKDLETKSLVLTYEESESATFAMLESFLSCMVGTKVQERQTGWSLLSKLTNSKKVSYQDIETNLNEFRKVDFVLQMIHEDDIQVEEFMNHLKKMDSSIQILEEEIECLFRQLIKTRVFLLNILNH